MSLHLNLSPPGRAAAVAFHLMWPAAAVASAQRFQDQQSSVYEVATIYDRLTDSTRVTVMLKGSSRPFGLGSRVWLDLSFMHRGVRLTVPPEAVVLTLRSFTPARGGWAFAHSRKLRVRSGKRDKLEIPAGEYAKLRVGLFDRGRREELSFRIPAEQFIALAAEPEIQLTAGNASIRFRDRRMKMLQEVVRRMTPSGTEVR